MISERKTESHPLVTGFVKTLRHLFLPLWNHATSSAHHRPHPRRMEHHSKGLPSPAPHLSHQQSHQLYFQSSSEIQPFLTISQVTAIPHPLAPQQISPLSPCPPSVCCQQSSPSEFRKRIEKKKQDWYPNRKMSRGLDQVLQKKNIQMTIKTGKKKKKRILRQKVKRN